MAKKLIRLTIDTDTEETYDIVSGILTLMISFGWEEKVLPCAVPSRTGCPVRL